MKENKGKLEKLADLFSLSEFDKTVIKGVFSKRAMKNIGLSLVPFHGIKKSYNALREDKDYQKASQGKRFLYSSVFLGAPEVARLVMYGCVGYLGYEMFKSLG